jgi:hypothetical protein
LAESESFTRKGIAWKNSKELGARASKLSGVRLVLTRDREVSRVTLEGVFNAKREARVEDFENLRLSRHRDWVWLWRKLEDGELFLCFIKQPKHFATFDVSLAFPEKSMVFIVTDFGWHKLSISTI